MIVLLLALGIAQPLPLNGYKVFMVGEFHGVKENAEFQVEYLRRLNLRDIVLEEKSVYEKQAQDYVDAKTDSLPRSLCLRTDILRRIRDLKAGIRVHFADIDSPATAIRQHLESIRDRLHSDIKIPQEISLEPVEQLKQLKMPPRILAELLTVEHSIKAYQQGFEADVGRAKGSTYLEDRESAIAGNILYLLKQGKVPAMLVVYGFDHVSKQIRKDGGPNRDQPFTPTALRLQQAGVKVFSLMTFPLEGRYWWRGQSGDILWTAEDGRFANGKSFGKYLAAHPEEKFIYIEDLDKKVHLPTDDMNTMFQFDAVLMFRQGTPMINHCTAN